MTAVAYPLRFRMRRPDVGELQAALAYLLDHGLLTIGEEETAGELAAALEAERSRAFFGKTTVRLVLAFQEQHGLPDSGEVDETTALAIDEQLRAAPPRPGRAASPIRVVRGTVSFDGGVPGGGLTIAAVDRGLRAEQELGRTKTGRDGVYRIEYSERDVREPERGTADVVVSAFDPAGTLLVASDIHFNAPPRLEVDLTIPAGRGAPPALFDRIGAAVEPLLGDLKIEELDEGEDHQDLTFLAGETGFGKDALARFVMAFQLVSIGVEPEFWFALLGRSAFAYSADLTLEANREQIAVALPTLDETAAGKSLDAAFAANDIRVALRKRATRWLHEFERLMAARLLGDGAAPTFAKQALDHAGIADAKKQARFAAIARANPSTSDLLTALGSDKSFTKAEIADITTSYRLADLTQSDFSVVALVKDTYNARTPEDIWSLAKLQAAGWAQALDPGVKAGTVTLPMKLADPAVPFNPPQTEMYAEALEQRFTVAFPTGSFAGGLERALSDGEAPWMTSAAPLAKFLAAHTDFELLCTPIDPYLDSGVKRGFKQLANNDTFRTELKAVQRIFKLTPTYKATNALLGAGLHSAQLIYRTGETAFSRQYVALTGGTTDEGGLVWRRAADTHAATLTLVGDLQALRGEELPLVLENNNEALSTFPNWDNLFKAGDLCDCEECRSVLGPAAYFADILMFLKDRKAANPANTAKDVLFARRADLGYLELNCDNAMTTLPYIDLVNEVLERVVAAGDNDVELAGFNAMPNGTVARRNAVEAALAGAGIDPGDFTLNQVDPSDPNRWVVHGDNVTLLLKKKATPNFFVEILPNTKADADELRAYPAYVDASAYDKLRQAQFPFGLPFDLFAAEVRAAFAACNLERFDLMRILRGPAAPNDPTDGEIAAEYFGISSDGAAAFDEKRLILVADATDAGQQAVWGEPGNAGYVNVVSNVKTFLHKTDLEYEQMLALIDLEFVNPAGDISVEHLDDSCDTDKKQLLNLTADRLDRIHRFLRLWRKLDGWQMWELDLAVRANGVGGGSLDEQFLTNLYYLGRVRTRLGGRATVEQLCALVDDLNMTTQFTELYKRRADGLYQSSFLNRTLMQPLDHAFDVSAVDVAGPTAEKISGHRPVVVSGLGISETDLDVLTALTRPSNGALYIGDDLTLANLSFLWRHVWLSKALKLKIADWKTLLSLIAQDVPSFPDHKAALEFIETVDHLSDTGVKMDALAWLLAADRTAQAAVKETDASRFLAALRSAVQAVHLQYDPAQYDFLAPPADTDRLQALLTSLLQQLHRDEAEAQFFLATLQDTVQTAQVVAGIPAGFAFPAAVIQAIDIRYDEPATTLRLTGFLTDADRQILLTSPALAAVTGIVAYQDAIEDLYDRPRLALKFFDPVFTAPLAQLPPAVDFSILADQALAHRISYDPDERVLQVIGITSADDKAALDALSPDAAYRNAVNTLFTTPSAGVFTPEQIWLQPADLTFPLADNLDQSLAVAITKALAYLSRTSAESLVIQQVGQQLGLSDGLSRRLLTEYAVLPATLLDDLTVTFAATAGVVEYATLKPTFDGWYWANRVAAIWKKWQLTLLERDQLRDLAATGAQVLDFAALPIDDAAPGAPLDRVLRANRLILFKRTVPETSVAFFDVLLNLARGDYAATADLAADVELMNGDWKAADVAGFVDVLDLAFPNDYLLAESWERLGRAFSFASSLNARASSAVAFAAATMNAANAKALKELLRSGLGADTWLPLCTQIQDALRESKRDALAAYLLTLPQPADAPSGKWEDTNDLYAYYLLDVEMSSCQLTSRLVQGSGSVQLFVQRCFMGLEPAVQVIADGADGDSAWHWWTWMRKYRVWEANREVFLWPENWIAPELKKDRSSFMKDLETELTQNEITTDTVERAFFDYLEKLNDVAELEPAGFYQEDDGDDAIVHVFGRTVGTDPPIYYYRRFDYRQWTPWEKVDLDIKEDYIAPAVVNGRLFLFWPMFMEVPDEEGNSQITTPDAKQPSIQTQNASKHLKLQLAVSDYRQGKWTPKRVSTDFLTSSAYDREIERKQYVFFPVDLSSEDGDFSIACMGHSVAPGHDVAWISGWFEISGCHGVPELGPSGGMPQLMIAPDDHSAGGLVYQRWEEADPRPDAPADDFSLETAVPPSYAHARATLLDRTPGIFEMTPGFQLSYLDELALALSTLLIPSFAAQRRGIAAGTWLPFFYNDQRRIFFVLPELDGRCEDRVLGIGNQDGEGPRYYPKIKHEFRVARDFFEGLVETWVDGLNLAMPAAVRTALEDALQHSVPIPEQVPPFSDAELREHLIRLFMRSADAYLAMLSLTLFQYRRFEFRNFYHPFVCDFAKLLENPLEGIPALMRRDTQLQDSGFDFGRTYGPTFWVVEQPTPTGDSYPEEIVDFTPDGAYSSYNWELFFHAPLFIANALSKNQQFEQACDWYHYIFNPIGVESSVVGGSAMSKYWITKPFFETTDPQYIQQRIENIMAMLAGDTTVPGYTPELEQALEDQVVDWRTNPFEPHRIANYRTVAYQKTVVMRYLDNLIAWGDYLFAQDSMESINEATQLYVLAAELLGPKPMKVPPQAKPPVESFNELENELDAFSNALVDVENLVPPQSGNSAASNPVPLPALHTLYFCIPYNETLISYWDTVADRLYKIRHCMNIEGVVRQLALFEPPIEPGALVKAVAAGVDIGAALADLDAPLPLYRFSVLLQKANELCSDVKALGGALLAALEKNDAEGLVLLRQGQEIGVLNRVTAVRQAQLDEANENLASAQRSRELAQIKEQYYASRDFMNVAETIALTLSSVSTGIDAAIAIAYGLAGGLKAVPQFLIGASGFGGSPHATAGTGGLAFGSIAEDAALTLGSISHALEKGAGISSTVGSYQRRQDEWNFQRDLAAKEIEQLDRSVAGAELRVQIAQSELDNHLAQIDDAKAIDAFMRSKYTNQELYQWQLGQISGVYFQTYKLAYDLAKRAERCYRFELGVQSSSYIDFGYWDSLKKGLLSGERLQYDLRRLEAAYFEQNRREFELTKNISLALLDPVALVTLRETGHSFFSLPEEISISTIRATTSGGSSP